MKSAAPALVCAALLSACAHRRPPAMAPAAAGSCRTEAVRWFAPVDPKERRRLDSWCSGVGPVVLSAAPDAPPGMARLRDITFVSWNVHVGNGNIPAFLSDLRAGLLTRGRPVGHVVLLLQEVVRLTEVPPLRSSGGTTRASGARRIGIHRGTATDIRELSRELGLSMIYAPSMRNGYGTGDPAADRGSAILSTLSLSDPVAVELPFERQRRVALLAAVPLAENKRLSLGVIHLDAVGAPRRLWVFGTPRMREAEARSLGALLPEGNLVLGADLNTWHGPEEPAARFFRELFKETPVRSDASERGRRILDYMFFRLDPALTAEYEVVRNEYGSDHHPLIGWIR